MNYKEDRTKKDSQYEEKVKKQVKESVTSVFVRALEDTELVLRTVEATLKSVGVEDDEEIKIFKDVYENMRRKILGAGNDAIRDIQTVLGIFDLEVKPDKKMDWIVFCEE